MEPESLKNVFDSTTDKIISNLNHHTAINCRAITGCPYGTNQSPVRTTHNSPEIHFREMFLK